MATSCMIQGVQQLSVKCDQAKNRPISEFREVEDKLEFVYSMAAKASTKRGLLTGYFERLQEKQSKERYLEKLKSIEGQDPYEISRKEGINDVDCWPDVTYINV